MSFAYVIPPFPFFPSSSGTEILQSKIHPSILSFPTSRQRISPFSPSLSPLSHNLHPPVLRPLRRRRRSPPRHKRRGGRAIRALGRSETGVRKRIFAAVGRVGMTVDLTRFESLVGSVVVVISKNRQVLSGHAVVVAGRAVGFGQVVFLGGEGSVDRARAGDVGDVAEAREFALAGVGGRSVRLALFADL